MEQATTAQAFLDLHKKGDPLILYNVWDAATAKAVENAGAKAIATGSHSVAQAHGFDDGEALPLDLLLTIVRRIVATTSLPVSVDFEGGFAVGPDEVAGNVSKLLATGVVGLNFEDQIVGGEGLYTVDVQADRIAAALSAGDEKSMPLVINARTDLFLKMTDNSQHSSLIGEAVERAEAYEQAGAKSFFVPGLVDPDLISQICEVVALPINIMMKPGAPSVQVLAGLRVARISYGPFAFSDAIAALEERAREALGT